MMDHSEFAQTVDRQSWRFAKTAKRNPHWYVVDKNWRDGRENFEEAVSFIRQHGLIEMFWRRPYTVYRVHGFKYWTMGDPMETTILINRARIAPCTEDQCNDAGHNPGGSREGEFRW